VINQSQGFFAMSSPAVAAGAPERSSRTCPRVAARTHRALKKFTVPLPAVVKDGTKIRLKAKASRLHAGPAGDLFVIAQVDESPVFEGGADLL